MTNGGKVRGQMGRHNDIELLALKTDAEKWRRMESMVASLRGELTSGNDRLELTTFGSGGWIVVVHSGIYSGATLLGTLEFGVEQLVAKSKLIDQNP